MCFFTGIADTSTKQRRVLSSSNCFCQALTRKLVVPSTAATGPARALACCTMDECTYKSPSDHAVGPHSWTTRSDHTVGPHSTKLAGMARPWSACPVSVTKTSRRPLVRPLIRQHLARLWSLSWQVDSEEAAWRDEIGTEFRAWGCSWRVGKRGGRQLLARCQQRRELA